MSTAKKLARAGRVGNSTFGASPAKIIEPVKYTVLPNGKVYVPANNPRFPKLAAALPAVLEAIERHWSKSQADKNLTDERFAKTAATANKLAEACVLAYSTDAKCPNSFDSMRQILQPKTPWDIWQGFNDGIAVGGHEPGYFVKCAMMEDSEFIKMGSTVPNYRVDNEDYES